MRTGTSDFRKILCRQPCRIGRLLRASNMEDLASIPSELTFCSSSMLPVNITDLALYTNPFSMYTVTLSHLCTLFQRFYAPQAQFQSLSFVPSPLAILIIIPSALCPKFVAEVCGLSRIHSQALCVESEQTTYFTARAIPGKLHLACIYDGPPEVKYVTIKPWAARSVRLRL